MGQPKCELCGGTSFVKEDGMFVCQGCGTKYTPEEAKSLMEEQPEMGKSSFGTTANEAASDLANAFAAAATVAAKVVEAVSAQSFDPKGFAAAHSDAREINNFVCAGWEAEFDAYKNAEHPTKEQQDQLVAVTKDCLAALNAAACLDGTNHVLGVLIYKNCDAMIDAVKDTDYYEEQEDGSFKRNSLPFGTDFKIAGMTRSWDDKLEAHQNVLEQAYLDAHPEDASERAALAAQVAQLEEELGELKDAKKSKGFFNFSAKREVKERMAPGKEELSGLRSQINAIDRRAADAVAAQVAQLASLYTRI